MARELGVRRGMPLGTAHRLAPDATFVDPDLDADRAALEAALERLAAFSPAVAGPTDPSDPAFGHLEAQVDGLDRLWGPEPVLVARVVAALAEVLPGPPRAGIAGTRFGASVAALSAQPGVPVLVPPGGEPAFLAPFPAALLTRDPEVRARLARFGLRRIGQVADLPTSALVARFGPQGARLGARARGEETDPFRPRRAPERLALGLPVEPPVGTVEPLRFVLRRLAGALADQLAARGAAAERAELRLELDRTFRPAVTLRTARYAQRFPEPTAEAEAIERLLLARLEQDPPPAPVGRVELELAGIAPGRGRQLALFVPQADRAARLGWHLARIGVAFGADRLLRAEVVDPEAPLPEGRARWRPAVDGTGGPSSGDARGASMERSR